MASQQEGKGWWSDIQLPQTTSDVFLGNRESDDFLDFQYYSEAFQYPLDDIFR